MGSCTEREEMFNLHPVGVRYICDFCNEGEMKVVKDARKKQSSGSLLSFFKAN